MKHKEVDQMYENISTTDITNYLNSLERCTIAYFEIKERRRQKWTRGDDSKHGPAA
ncbi:hypothetical protein KY335_01590 [Candidatus Woesearchaeota archaeon]|nr:hypothetical protein [Candidatus Woesearchaeota archaeon]